MKSFCDRVTGYGTQFPYKVKAKPNQNENLEMGDNSNIKQDDSKIGLLSEVWHEFARYCENSTIHGVKYLGRKNVHWSERIWWIVSFAIAAVICISCINKMYLKITPTTITFDDNYTPISEIPFPTVTICNPFTVDTGLLNYSGINQQILDSNYTNRLSRKVIQQMYSASLFCLNGTTIREYINRNNKTIDRNIWPYLKQISPGIGMRECKLSRRDIYCPDLFTKVLTFYGTCYTFNHLSSEEVYYEEELADDFPKFKKNLIEKSNSTWPHKKFTNFHDNPDIIFDLQIFQTDNDPSCNLYPRDLLLFIHPAEDQDASKEISVPLDHISRVNLRPNKITTDPNLINSLSKEERKCVNINDAMETNLTFFRKYSQKNCYYEKFVRRLIWDCRCAFFWMPRWNETELCSWESHRDCWSSVDQSFAHGSAECLPACNSFTYDATMITHNENISSADGRLVKIAIFFDDHQYLFMRRSEIYGPLTFYSGCAGILSLFMGASFLSVSEILYFVAVRPCWNRRHRKTETSRQRDECKETVKITLTMKPRLEQKT